MVLKYSCTKKSYPFYKWLKFFIFYLRTRDRWNISVTIHSVITSSQTRKIHRFIKTSYSTKPYLKRIRWIQSIPVVRKNFQLRHIKERNERIAGKNGRSQQIGGGGGVGIALPVDRVLPCYILETLMHTLRPRMTYCLSSLTTH